MKTLLFSTLLAALATACVTADPDTIHVTDQHDAELAAGGGKSDAISEFHVVDVALPDDALEDQAFIVFTSRRSFRDHYGLDGNLDVDFRSQWVFVYQAGAQPTGGYIPGIIDITRRNNRIRFQTQLATPGEGCFTTEGESRPYVVVAFRKPTQPSAARFSVSHGETDNVCEPTTCELVDCLPHLVCDASSGHAECVPVCPAPGTTINCKLPLTPERELTCNPSFQSWVGGHCPDVTFAL